MAGWRASYGAAGLRLTGTLERLNPHLSGSLALASSSTLQGISGTLKNAVFGPVALGDVALREVTADGGRALNLSGPALGARVGLSRTLPWQLERLELALPGNVRLHATGSGVRTTGSLATTVDTASYSFPVAASYSSGTLALAGRGELPLGTLELGARYGGGAWAGSVRVIGEDANPVLTSRLSGGLTTPRLTGTLALTRGENTVAGTFDASRDALALSSTLSSPQLAAPLRLEAAGWPLSATLHSRSQTLSLRLQDGQLVPSGTLDLRTGPATLRVLSANDSLRLRLAFPAAPGLILRTDLPTRLSEFSALLGGLTLTGAGKTQGTLTLALRPNPSAQLDALRWQGAGGRLTLNGTVGVHDGLAADLTGNWRGSANAPLPWLQGATLPFTVQAQKQTLRVQLRGRPRHLGRPG